MLSRRHHPWRSEKGGNHMAKGQKRSNREVKKPKATKKKPAPARSTITTGAPKKP
jgi:hypothetical protein